MAPTRHPMRPWHALAAIGAKVVEAGDQIGHVCAAFGEVVDATLRSHDRMPPNTRPRKGDLIARRARFHWHYGVYEDDANVYHPDPHAGRATEGPIDRTSLSGFLGGESGYFIVVLGDRGASWIFEVPYDGGSGELRPRFTEELTFDLDSGYYRFAVFPADTVVARAASRLGEARGHLLGDNCEHFATWCVTGTRVSWQAARLTNLGKALRGEDPRYLDYPASDFLLAPSELDLEESISYDTWCQGHAERPSTYSPEDEILRWRANLAYKAARLRLSRNPVLRLVGTLLDYLVMR